MGIIQIIAISVIRLCDKMYFDVLGWQLSDCGFCHLLVLTNP